MGYVPYQKEVQLPLNHRLHVGVFPNLGFMVGALPVCVAVQDQVFVISKNLNVMLSIRYIMIFFLFFRDQNPDPAFKMMHIYNYTDT